MEFNGFFTGKRGLYGTGPKVAAGAFVSLVFAACMGPEQAAGPVAAVGDATSEDKAYEELMALQRPEALGKYSAYGSSTNLVSCGVMSEGDEPVYYNLDLMDAQLEALPSFGKILGFEAVDNCAKALKFIEKKYEILEGRPSPQMLLESVSQAVVEALGKTSIRQGIVENSHGKVMLWFAGGNFCTGTVIGPRAILTAAHCLQPSLIFNGVPVKSGRNYAQVDYFSPALPASTYVTIAYGEMHMIIHGAYAGDGDTMSDVGLIITDAPLPTSDYMKFYVGSMSNGRRNRIYGAGNNSHAETGYGVLRRGNEYVDWYGEHHYYATESGSMQTCPGDSGGPWVRDDGVLMYITGVHSNSDKSRPNNCTTSGGRMRAARMNTKIGWIGAQLSAYGAGGCSVSGDFGQCF